MLLRVRIGNNDALSENYAESGQQQQGIFREQQGRSQNKETDALAKEDVMQTSMETKANGKRPPKRNSRQGKGRQDEAGAREEQDSTETEQMDSEETEPKGLRTGRGRTTKCCPQLKKCSVL